MTLFIATLLLGLILITKGLFCLAIPSTISSTAFKIIRSHKAGCFLFALAGSWFLWHISQLTEADFGQLKHWLFLLFTITLLGSFIYLKDFLFVRAWAIFLLLLSQIFLDAAYMQPSALKLFFVSFIYLIILSALYFGALPYKMRD